VSCTNVGGAVVTIVFPANKILFHENDGDVHLG
jgi:hypothetical protein